MAPRWEGEGRRCDAVATGGELRMQGGVSTFGACRWAQFRVRGREGQS